MIRLAEVGLISNDSGTSEQTHFVAGRCLANDCASGQQLNSYKKA
jgi:hypothetical protein